MATATKKVRSAGRVTGGGRVARVESLARTPAPMEFLIYEDNGGSYHWKIVGGDRQTLALSGGFDSPAKAQKAAKYVRDRASSALLENPAPEAVPLVLRPPRDGQGDASDAERWLDEGGSSSTSAVA